MRIERKRDDVAASPGCSCRRRSTIRRTCAYQQHVSTTSAARVHQLKHLTPTSAHIYQQSGVIKQRSHSRKELLDFFFFAPPPGRAAAAGSRAAVGTAAAAAGWQHHRERPLQISPRLRKAAPLPPLPHLFVKFLVLAHEAVRYYCMRPSATSV